MDIVSLRSAAAATLAAATLLAPRTAPCGRTRAAPFSAGAALGQKGEPPRILDNSNDEK